MHSESATGLPHQQGQENSPEPWLNLARRLRGRVNLAWWLQSWLSWWMGSLLVGAVLILLQRLGVIHLPTSAVLYGILAMAILSGLHCWLRTREQWISQQAALQRLEAEQQLNNALSTAAAGVAAWPRYGREQNELPLAWQWRRILPLLLVPLALLGISLLVPQKMDASSTAASSRPAAWEQIESVLLEQNLQQLADPARVEAMREEMQRLGSRPPGEWFEHQSLETGDRVASMLNSGLEQSERNLAEAARVVQRLDEGKNAQGQPLSDAQREELSRQLEQNLQNLQNQPLGISEEMRKRLMQMEPEKFQGMNPQQAQQMMQDLRQWSEQAGKLGEKMGQQGSDKPLWQQLLEEEQQGGGGQGEEGQGNQPGQNGQPSAGGINRGPGTAPLTLKPDESLLDPSLQAGLKGDAEGMQPGQQLGESLSTAEVEPTQMGQRAGGAAQQEGRGGDRVWRQQLTPSEQNLLENYFE